MKDPDIDVDDLDQRAKILKDRIDEETRIDGNLDENADLWKDRVARMWEGESFYSITVDIRSLSGEKGYIAEGAVEKVYENILNVLDDSAVDVIYADDEWKTVGVFGDIEDFLDEYRSREVYRNLEEVEIEVDESLPDYQL